MQALTLAGIALMCFGVTAIVGAGIILLDMAITNPTGHLSPAWPAAIGAICIMTSLAIRRATRSNTRSHQVAQGRQARTPGNLNCRLPG